MSRVRVAGFGVSLDGFGAGPEQSLSDPLGKRGTDLFQWYFHTRTFCSMVGQKGGSVGDIDDVFASRAMENFGAFILGHSGQDLRQNLPRLWERGLAMGIIGAPHHIVHANNVPQADTDLILLEAQADIAVEKVTGTPAVLEPI